LLITMPLYGSSKTWSRSLWYVYCYGIVPYASFCSPSQICIVLWQVSNMCMWRGNLC